MKVKQNMATHRRYYRRSRIPESKFCELAAYFAQDLSATEVARLTGLTRKSVTSIFLKLRRRIAEERERNFALSNESHSDAEDRSCTQCFCGRCRKQLSRNTPLFGLLTNGEQVLTAPVPDCRKPILRALIRGRVSPREIAVNGWHGFDALVDAEYAKPYIVEHRDSISNGRPKGIDSFWSFVRHRLEKFNGVPKRTFYLHLKESEWRFNLHEQNLYPALMKLIESHPL